MHVTEQSKNLQSILCSQLVWGIFLIKIMEWGKEIQENLFILWIQCFARKTSFPHFPLVFLTTSIVFYGNNVFIGATSK